MAGMSRSKIFRDVFEFTTKDTMHWFPGHMHKGMQQLQKTLRQVDCIIEVHDARMPFSGRNSKFKGAITLRPHILLLNKEDLADTSQKKAIQQKLKEEGVNEVLYTNCKEQFNNVINKELVPTITNLIDRSDRYHRSSEDHFNLLIIGVPNVGKSSLINTLRRTHLKKGGKATKVGAIAGVTRSVLERIKVSDKPSMYLYDTPGILSPNINNVEVGMKLAACATLQDHLVGEDTIADYLLYWLNKHEMFQYVEYLNLTEPTDDVYEALAQIAKNHNRIMKRKNTLGQYVYRPNFLEAASIMLRAFREGHLGKVMLDSDILSRHYDMF